VTGIYASGPANTREQLEALGCGPGDSKWFDLSGKAKDSFQLEVCEQKILHHSLLKQQTILIPRSWRWCNPFQ
jgi:hypothetical protein